MKKETYGKKSIAFILLGLYLIVLGLFWLFSISFYRTQQTEAEEIYTFGMNFLKTADGTISKYHFQSDKQKTDYTARYGDFKSSLEGIKKNYIDSIPTTGVVMGLVALFTAVFYAFSGCYLLRQSRKAKRFLRWGICGFLLFNSLIIADLFLLIIPINKKIERLMSALDSSQNYSLIPWAPTLLIIIFFLTLGYFFNILVPHYFINRLKVNLEKGGQTGF